jgi:AcrR family transcriptional regulator
MARVAAVKVEATRTSILDAARSVLRERGYASLSTREVAAVAGVPLSQIHYHFGSKQGMVLALFEYMNARLLERQNAMFADPSLSLSEQWDLACDYLDDDLATGYVRVLQELMAVGWTDPEIGRVVRDGVLGWIELLTDLARRAQDTYGSLGPFTPEDIAALVGAAFIGMESYLLLGIEERGLPLRRSLRRFGDVIRVLEERGNQGRK